MFLSATVGKQVSESSLATWPAESMKLDRVDKQVLAENLPLKAGLTYTNNKIPQCQLQHSPVFRRRLQDVGCRNISEGRAVEFLQVKRIKNSYISHVIYQTEL